MVIVTIVIEPTRYTEVMDRLMTQLDFRYISGYPADGSLKGTITQENLDKLVESIASGRNDIDVDGVIEIGDTSQRFRFAR